jgi:hypothetical protein
MASSIRKQLRAVACLSFDVDGRLPRAIESKLDITGSQTRVDAQGVEKRDWDRPD